MVVDCFVEIIFCSKLYEDLSLMVVGSDLQPGGSTRSTLPGRAGSDALRTACEIWSRENFSPISVVRTPACKSRPIFLNSRSMVSGFCFRLHSESQKPSTLLAPTMSVRG